MGDGKWVFATRAPLPVTHHLLLFTFPPPLSANGSGVIFDAAPCARLAPSRTRCGGSPRLLVSITAFVAIKPYVGRKSSEKARKRESEKARKRESEKARKRKGEKAKRWAEIPNSQLSTLNSQLPTPNSQLPTPNSQLPTPNSQLSTLNSQLSTLNSQLPTPNSQLSTPNSQLSTLNSQLSTPNS